MSLSVRVLKSKEAQVYFQQIARLRIEVFREYPYLYEGDLDYEKKYLGRYFESLRSVFVLVFDKDVLVGVATALPLEDEIDEIKEPFLRAGHDLTEIFYFGESLLKKEYRGKGLGHRFFDGREQAALSYPQIKKTVFCAVQRPYLHKLRPEDYRPLDEFWSRRGYQKRPELVARLIWKDLDEQEESPKSLVFWMRSWRDRDTNNDDTTKHRSH
jgi:GNAT superfamily N-acetyltransferase